MDGLQIRITRCIVIGRLSKQQQDISGERANVWGVSEWPLRMAKTSANGLYEKSRVNVVTAGCDPLLQEFNDVFEDLGKLEGQYTIVTDPSVKPIVHPPRRLPVALIDQVQEKLDNMVKYDIIAKVDQPTDWVSSMLAVRKPTLRPDGKVDIRICLDPKDLNGAIKREHFPMPTIEEVATRLNGAKIFSVFDASDGFWQVELDQASSRFTTFNTPFGRIVGNVCRLV
jgi:hypothetical protein